MNFFGHAAIARERTDRSGVVFGAMLPDLLAMARLRPLDPLDAEIREGVALHHATDEAFHRSATFLGLCRVAREQLRACGIDGAPARALAHVGTELWLDAVAFEEHPVRERYVPALAHGRALLRAGALGEPGALAPLEALLERLAHAGLDVVSAEPRALTLRLCSVLARRPRLWPGAHVVDRVERFCAAHRETVRRAAALLLDDVRRGIQASAQPSAAPRGADP
ncbi:MAG: hypothetical protein NZ898_02305 [Myxococcota bacterium]|nr:hypothetical protein [Myxococcota bacterium]MDW8361102.1 hypothetical protein [Myxococcales bacterium]